MLVFASDAIRFCYLKKRLPLGYRPFEALDRLRFCLLEAAVDGIA